MALSSDEQKRYARQMMMDGWGEETQAKLQRSTVFVAGAGGLGSPVAIYLAVAGIGQLRLCDFDAPELSNLNRQILHDHTRVGTNKAVSGKQTLAQLNPHVEVTALTTKITEETVDELLGQSEIIVDCMDNFATRAILNDAAIRRGIPLVHGSIWGMEGRIFFVDVPKTPCLRCVFPEGPPPEVFPVLGATPGVIGSLQAMETVKYLTGIGKPPQGQLVVWDGSQTAFRSFRVHRDENCPACSSAHNA